MEHGHSDDVDLRMLFNSLSLVDQVKLRTAAFTVAVTGVIRDDTEAHPERFPLYVLYLALLTVPVPLMGLGVGVTTVSALGATAHDNEWSRWVRSRLADSLDGEKTTRLLRRFVVADEKNPGKWRVDNTALAWFSTVNSFKDSGAATGSAIKGLIHFTKKML